MSDLDYCSFCDREGEFGSCDYCGKITCPDHAANRGQEIIQFKEKYRSFCKSSQSVWELLLMTESTRELAAQPYRIVDGNPPHLVGPHGIVADNWASNLEPICKYLNQEHQKIVSFTAQACFALSAERAKGWLKLNSSHWSVELEQSLSDHILAGGREAPTGASHGDSVRPVALAAEGSTPSTPPTISDREAMEQHDSSLANEIAEFWDDHCECPSKDFNRQGYLEQIINNWMERHDAELVYAARSARDWFSGAILMDKEGNHNSYRADPVALDMLNRALLHFEGIEGVIPKEHP